MNDEPFELMLTGGHPNSLGRTIEVVDTVLADSKKLNELYNCYFSHDEVVRLRTSNALKRISKEQPGWLVPYLDRFINDISQIDQASTHWTLAKLFDTLAGEMNEAQRASATAVLKRNLANHTDWIVLNNTMQTLANWSKTDETLKAWLLPHLERLQEDSRKSVANRARKLLKTLS
mgnify:CR=1 FL=1